MEDPVSEVSQEKRDVSSPVKVKKNRSPKTHAHRRRLIAGVLVIMFISLSTGFLGGWLGSHNRLNTSNSKVNVAQGRQLAEEQSSLISSIAKDVGPSVVSVDVTSQGTTNQMYGIRTQDQQSAGTGVIISDSGYVVTNRHVIPSGTKKVSLTLSDGTVLDNVSVVGTTSDSDSLDLGFLKINDTKGKKLTVAQLGDSSKMQVGDTVVAIGNALGQFQNSVTSGIISGYGRSVQASNESGANAENLQNLFQTDAAINEGNSGGPLVNSDGQVIGINVAVAGGAQNIGFSIPINDASGLIKSVLEKGVLERPYLGVRYQELTPAIANSLGIDAQEGAYIVSGSDGTAIVSGSPAAKANLQEGDIIVKVNNDDVTTKNNLSSLIGRYNVGDTVTLTFIRDGKQQTAQVTLAALPN